MNRYVKKVVSRIPVWSKKLQGLDGATFVKELKSARNFVTDYSMNNWTFGKSVGFDGEYHWNGAEARKRLERLGFVDILQSKKFSDEQKQLVEEKFRAWARDVRVFNLVNKLELFKMGRLKAKIRLMIPPGLFD